MSRPPPEWKTEEFGINQKSKQEKYTDICLSWQKDSSHATRIRKGVYEICEVDNLLEKAKIFSFGTRCSKKKLGLHGLLALVGKLKVQIRRNEKTKEKEKNAA